MALLLDRAPVPLLTFLGIHEQSNLGFGKTLLKKMSAINLVSGDPTVRILSNEVIVKEGIPKTYYRVSVMYKSHRPIQVEK